MTTTTAMTDANARPPMTAETILRLFPDIDTTSDALSGHDEEQIRLMDEMCIVTDENDNAVGKASKKLCHLMSNINKGLIHRAFSVFLFNDKNELLLQQRAAAKITFPNAWTNTCCSHPLAVSGESGSTFWEAVDGAKRAAQRKLNHELGIKKEQVPFEKFRFLTRICYKAPSDDKWGEHEVDYILFIKANVHLDINENEVQAVRYARPEDVKKMMDDATCTITPWFRLICKTMLFEWWDSLANKGEAGLDQFANDEAIVRMK
ncbi:hypothetical protein CDD81_2697 [Ophiocordyceps australis]|uniref:isopentenyl-diphosphate Delta-isomerase n=1 Tax=Ophiocordyceps australis TaxID=1399860 RepID=A0A2C5Y720_9HYPO|nr:hypothetical protein CDD81_2697 [Ophiocordyceps australis]